MAKQFSRVYSAQPFLLDSTIISVEADISQKQVSPTFSVVGMTNKSVDEARDRVNSAIRNSGFVPPKEQAKQIIISLAPAEIKKSGSFFDVAIALSYLLADNQISFNPENKIFLGELSLNGDARPIRGTIALCDMAKRLGFEEVYVPKENSEEASYIEGIKVFGFENLKELISHISDNSEYSIQAIPTKSPDTEEDEEDYFARIKGQENAKRAILISAAGGHNIAMYGPPGTGKTILARAFVYALPELDKDKQIETTGIHSIAGITNKDNPIITRPPFRSPHHTASHVSIIGGGANVMPGEVTLAHNGVLFMDELPEFPRKVLESLRQPIEDGKVSISRAQYKVTYPSQFILVGAMNPCPCGNYGSSKKECICAMSEIKKYKKRISGPIMDRIDIWIELDNVDYELLSKTKTSEENETKKIREAVTKARNIQKGRWGKLNSRASFSNPKEFLIANSALEILNKAGDSLGISPRVYFKLLKVARTIADIENKEEIINEHILEALQYRPKEDN